MNNAPTKAKRQENKATRMPQNELLDRIFDMYTGPYEYIPLGVFKSTLHQPEAWLKETLDKVAILVKGGSFNLTYRLREEAKAGRNIDLFKNAKAEVAPMTSFGLDGPDDFEEDDEDMKMEDVL